MANGASTVSRSNHPDPVRSYRCDVPPEVEPIWPVDLDDVRLWPMEGEDGPLLQELFDDLADFRTPFGEPGSADAVSTFLALPEGRDYNSKLLLGIWLNGGLAGALDCIMGYPTSAEWTVGLLVVADRYRRRGIARAVLDWLATIASGHGAATLRVVVREANSDGVAVARALGYELEGHPSTVLGCLVLVRSLKDACAPRISV